MLGKSGGVAAGFAVLFALSCAHNVKQDKASGEDHATKGARSMELENGEAKASGIVTYPGGDRVDWKVIELPEEKMGDLDIRLSWQPPRKGLQLAFDVFDQWYTPVVQSKRRGRRRSTSRTRTASIDDAKGKYYIRVYAVGRGDAGKYKLKVEFKESNGPMAIDLTKVEIPEPPRLAAVPEPEAVCDEFTFDVKNPACRSVCPTANAPAGWPACKGKCPEPADVNNPACWNTMPCPNPPDRRVKACPKSKWPKCQDINNPDPNNPNCDDAKAEPVMGRVIKTEIQGGQVLITVSGGSSQGVGPKWKGQVLRGDSDSPLDGGSFDVIRVGKRESLGKVRLTTDQIGANPRVKLSPP